MDPHTQASERIGALVAEKYRLDRLLGTGGMGAVYEALHLFTDRRVAVKLLHAPYLEGTSVVAQRFLLEAKAAAAIPHPSVVEVLDAGVAAGVPYVVFELLEGETLASALLEGHLNQGDLLDVAGQVLEMLELAHARGIVHRDIKPENVFVCRGAGGALRAKVLDFGIARRLDRPLDGAPLTQQGAVLGTPFYMSPEQMLGDPVDGRADVWAVGAVLFRGLSGYIPFEARSYAALLAELLQRGAAPLSRYRPDLPEALRAVVDRAMARDPEARWSSAAEMRRALGPFMRGSPRNLADEVGGARSAPPAPSTPPPVVPDTLASVIEDTAPPSPAVPMPLARVAVEPARDRAVWERALGEIEGEIEALRARGSAAPPARDPRAARAPDADGGAWLKKLFPPKKGTP